MHIHKLPLTATVRRLHKKDFNDRIIYIAAFNAAYYNVQVVSAFPGLSIGDLLFQVHDFYILQWNGANLVQ